MHTPDPLPDDELKPEFNPATQNTQADFSSEGELNPQYIGIEIEAMFNPATMFPFEDEADKDS